MTTLIESKARPFGSSKGVAMSMVIHGALFAGILFGTAKAVLPPREKIEEHHVLYVAAPPPPVHVAPAPLPEVKTPPKAKAAAPRQIQAPPPKVAQAKTPPTPALVAPTKVALSLPAIDLKAVPTISDVVVQIAAEPVKSGVPTGGSARKAGDDDAEGGRGKGGLGSGSGRAYDENQVDRAVQVTKNIAPRFPDALRSVGVQGVVSMRFIVGADGKVEPGSMQVISTPHKLFADAVKTALLNTRYRPAEAAGHAVRQLVEQTFQFQLQKVDG